MGLGSERIKEMETTLVTSVSQFLSLIENGSDLFLYRGQADYAWKLEPSISRADFKEIKFPTIKGAHDFLIQKFINQASYYINGKEFDEVDWTMQTQHYGIPTCLLDLSTSPLTALYFAVEDDHYPIMDRDEEVINAAVYVIIPKSISIGKPKTLEKDDIMYFHPPMMNSRMLNQNSVFALFPLTDKLPLEIEADWSFSESATTVGMIKIPISGEHKKSIKRSLDLIGINRSTIYPSLESVAYQIREKYLC